MEQSLLSVGIDIGTTTTQVIFSKLLIQNSSNRYSVPDVKIIRKEIIYKSKIHFTPLLSFEAIDGEKLKNIIIDEYSKAGINSANIDTGAVIITGETARKENARLISEHLANLAGDFVVCTAGPDLEAILAGRGAGTGEFSKKTSKKVINFDIGGGTTNAVVFSDGEVVDVFAADIGGRLIRCDEEGRIIYISKRLSPVLEMLDIDVSIGDKADIKTLEKLTDRLAEMFLEFLVEKELMNDTKQLFIMHEYKGIKAEYIMFSGGVAEFIYRKEILEDSDYIKRFGDIGPLLGISIKNKFQKYKERLIRSKETIRATVIGAGSHITELSGSTITQSERELPLKNIPVIKVFDSEKEDIHILADKIAAKSSVYIEQTVAIAFKGMKSPSYKELKTIAENIIEGIGEGVNPIIVLLESDFAKALGQTISNMKRNSRSVICLDKISVSDGDYIDIGKPIAGVVPVIVKTLIFN